MDEEKKNVILLDDGFDFGTGCNGKSSDDDKRIRRAGNNIDWAVSTKEEAAIDVNLPTLNCMWPRSLLKPPPQQQPPHWRLVVARVVVDQSSEKNP